MTTPWRKAWRDFGQERARTVLVVLAIALGIAGFGAVLSAYAVLTRELNAGYLATHPAAATLYTDRVDATVEAGVRALEGVGDVEARRSVSARIKVRPGDWRGLVLFVVEDFRRIRISTLVPQNGAWPPRPGGILVERDAFQVMQARTGDTATVRTSAGNEATLRIVGSVHDVGQAQARMEQVVYAYATPETLRLLGEEPYLDQLKLAVAGNASDETHVRSVATSVQQWLETNGHPVRRVDVPSPGKHPHADLMGLLLLAQSSFGLIALALSGILVVNLTTALMAAQVRSIGVMKAVGGGTGQVARIYLAQAFLLGVAAVVVAVPLGMLGGRAICRAMAVFLNFDIRSFGVPPWVYALECLVGLVVPVAAAAWPVCRASAITVHQALSDSGTGRTAFGVTAFDRALTSVRGVTRPVLLAVRNAFRRRTRMALTTATLAAGGLFFMSALNVRGSMIHTLDRMFGAMKFDLTISFPTPRSLDAVDRAARRTAGVERIEGWITTEASIVQPGATPDLGSTPESRHAPVAGPHGAGALSTARFTVIALPPDSSMLTPAITEGRALRTDDANAIVVNTRLAAGEPAMAVGRDVTLTLGHRPTTWRVVGRVWEPFSPPTAYVSRSHLDQLSGGMLTGKANRIAVAIAPAAAGTPESLGALKADLETRLAEEGLRTSGLTSKGERRVGFDEHMLMIYVFLVVVSSILGGVGGLGLMTTMSLNVTERRRELGVLRAIGASPSMLWRLVLAEAAVVVGLSWAAATALAWPLSRWLGATLVRAMFRTGVDFRFEPAGPLVWLLVGLLLAVLASALPAWRAARLTVREALAHE